MRRLSKLIAEAIERVNKMTPEEKIEMLKEQRRSFVRAEAGFGSDQDEAEYAAALRAGDHKKIKQLDAAAQERIRVAEKLMKDLGL